MHPAISVIFFTVTSGAGFALMALLGVGMPVSDSSVMVFAICAIALGLAVAGLISSTFHLGHPKRAWRAFSQWRTSWLSREGIFSVATLITFGLYAGVWVFIGTRVLPLGVIAAVFALLTIHATAMIYAQLKTVPSWHSWMTPVCYMSFGLSSAFVLVAAFSDGHKMFLINSAIGLIIFAWAVKVFWWKRAGDAGFSDRGSNVGTATGLGAIGEVKLLERPHTGENYLTKEMVHQIGRKHAKKLRRIALVFGGGLPIFICLCVIFSGLPVLVLILAFLSMLIGIFAERWLFFAEAQHTVSLYY